MFKKILLLWLWLFCLSVFVPGMSYPALDDQGQVQQGRFGRVGQVMGKMRDGFSRAIGRGNRVSSNTQTESQTNPTVYNNAPSVKSSGNQGSGQVVQLLTRDNGSTQTPARAATIATTQSTQNIQLTQTQTSQTSFQATSVEIKQNAHVFQNANDSRPTIPQISAESNQDAGGGAFGRNTTKPTEKASEGVTPPPEAGEAVWLEREEKEEITLEVLLNATGKLMRIAEVGEHVIERFESFSGMALKLLGTSKQLLDLNDPFSSSKSFEEQMGEKLVGRILGKEGPAPSLLAILGPEVVGKGVTLGIDAIPIPGMQIAGTIVGNVVAKGMSHLMKVQLPYGTAYSVVQAAYLSKSVANSFHQVYAPILEKLTPEERQDLITHAVNTAIFHVDEHVLQGEERSTITHQSVMRSIGTEFMDLDARMPRAGLLLRKLRNMFVEKSGLETHEARALLTSTPVNIEGNYYHPTKQDDPRKVLNEVLVERLLWRGVIKSGPTTLPQRFQSLYRSGDIGYGRIMGFIPPAVIENGGETAAAA